MSTFLSRLKIFFRLIYVFNIFNFFLNVFFTSMAAMTKWINIKMNKFTVNKHMKQLQDDNGDYVHLAIGYW